MSVLDDEKLFYERFNALHGDPQLLSICEKFGISAFRRSAVLENFAKIKFSGKRCVEIGTRNALTAIVLARNFDEVISIDIEPNDLKHEIVRFCGVKNIVLLDCKDNNEKRSLIGDLEFDAAYVDGDHARDTQSDFDLVKKCGKVLFHEYWEAQPAVMKLVDSLRPNVQVFGKFALWTA